MGVTRPVEPQPLLKAQPIFRLALHSLMSLAWASFAGAAFAWVDAAQVDALRSRFAQEVAARIEVPISAQIAYAERLDTALIPAGLSLERPQFVVLIDRNPFVQMVSLLLGQISNWHWVGAARASTGRPGSFEHFITPLGVFDHSLLNHDFRAEGTFNSQNIRGYGLRGMRVFDLGWVLAERAWGRGGMSLMRLQMHATDPDVLEPRLGRPASKGCIRIPATLNSFIDRYGLLDEDYFRAEAQGRAPWVLRPDREPTPWPGRYVVVVDSELIARPAWATLPWQSP